MRRYASSALAGVGDVRAGEWWDPTGVTGKAHLRRRLSDRDMLALPGPHRTLVDVRRWTPDELAPLLAETMSSFPSPALAMLVIEAAKIELAAGR